MSGSTSSPMGKTYLSTAVSENGAPKELVANTRIRLGFEEVPNQNAEGPPVYDVLRAHAGCNRLTAAVEAGDLLADGKLWIDGVGGTARGGAPALLAQDSWLTDFLVSRPGWHVDGDQLTLTSAGTTITLLDRRLAEPDFPLDGPRWKVRAVIIKDGDLRAHHHRAKEAWITFRGTHVTGWTGCNELSGTVTRTNTELTFTDVATTDNACTGETAQVETAILTTLTTKITYTIDHNRLTLLTPTGTGLDLTALAPGPKSTAPEMPASTPPR